MEYFLYDNSWWMFIVTGAILISVVSYLIGRGER